MPTPRTIAATVRRNLVPFAACALLLTGSLALVAGPSEARARTTRTAARTTKRVTVRARAVTTKRGRTPVTTVAPPTTAAPAPTPAPTTAPAPTTTVPAPTTTTAPPAAAPAGPAMGLSMGDRLRWMSPADLAATLDDAKAVGVGWIRIDLSWAELQQSASAAPDWSGIDAVVAAASARGLQVLPILTYTPAWARAAGCTSMFCAPTSTSAFAAFAAAAATRYAPQGVHTWEVWNEPNVKAFWTTPSPTAYAALLQAASSALKGADPSAKVMSGGLAPAATSGGDIAPTDFLRGVCAAGGLAGADLVGVHPYSFPVLPSYQASWNAWQQLAWTTTSLKGVLAGCGEASLPLWATEYGAPTGGPGAQATASDLNLGASPDHVDEALQAQMATQSVAIARQTGVVGGLFWYTTKDLGTDRSTIENFFGLRRADGSAKPAWAALHAALAS